MLFYSVIALVLLLGGCTEDITDTLDRPINKDGSIAFLTSSALTRGTPREDLTAYGAVHLLAYAHAGSYSGERSLYRQVSLTKVGSGANPMWDYSPHMFWPDGRGLSFLSYASDVAFATTSGQPGVFIKSNGLKTAPTVEYVVPADVTKQPDLLVSAILDQPKANNVLLSMKHALACVSFCATGLPAMKVKSITMKKVYGKGTLALDNTSLKWNLDLGSKGVTAFEPGIQDKPLTEKPTDNSYLMTANGYLMMIPQTLTDAYIDVIYWKGTAGTEKMISYPLPTTVAWEPGKRYIYKFGEAVEEILVYYEKYSDETYGFQSKTTGLAPISDVKAIKEAGYGVLSKNRTVSDNPTLKLGAGVAVVTKKVPAVSGEYNLYAVSQSGSPTFVLPQTSLAPVEVYFDGNNVSCGKIVPHFAKGVSDWNIDPLPIRTPQQMRNISVATASDPFSGNFSNRTFKQERNLDFATANSAIGGGALSGPVVDQTFSGTYNGNAKVISNVTISASGANYVGLFSQSIGTINDVTLKSSTISGNDYVGAIVGWMYGDNGAINRPQVIGTANTTAGQINVTGGSYVGGIVGLNQGALTGNAGVDPATAITFAEVSGWVNISGRGNYVGGIAGCNRHWNTNGSINTVLVYGVLVMGSAPDELVVTKVTIKGGECVGGIVGGNEAPIKGNVAGTGSDVKNMPDVGGMVEIRGTTKVGGIAGLNAVAGTLNSVNIRLGRTGQTIIAGTGDNVGGIVGENWGKLGTESNNTFISTRGNIAISGANNVGGIVGVNGTNAELQNCFVYEYYTRIGTLAYFAPQITAATSNVGGIAGSNASSISDCSVFSASNTATSLVKISSVNNAGGIAGANISGSETNNCSLVGKVIVEAKAQAAGGIFGDAKSGIKITNCWVGSSDGNNIITTAQTTLGLNITPVGVSTPSYGTPAITGNSYIGGIVGLNNGGVIDGILLSDNVTIGRKEVAVNDGSNWVGGIVGGNTPSYMGQTNVIKNCSVKNAVGKTVVIQGSTNLGGIAGLNNGVVDNCTVSGVQAAPLKIIGLGTIGGIVGQNGGHGDLAQTGNDYTIISNSSVTGYVTLQGNAGNYGLAVAVGGIVGLNGPTKDIINNISKCVVRGASAGSISISVFGTTGGIVGTNSGNLNACDVQNTSISSKGYYAGGIAGQTTVLALKYTPPYGFRSNLNDCRIYPNVAITGKTDVAANIAPGALVGYLDSKVVFVLGSGAPNLVNNTLVTVGGVQPTQGTRIVGFATGDGGTQKASINHTVKAVAPR